MASFRTRALQVLDRCFQFAAGSPTAPTEFSIESPITPVYDVRRDHQLGVIETAKGAGGYYQVGTDLSGGAGAGNLDDVLDPYAVDVPPKWGDPANRWVWYVWRPNLLIDVLANFTSANQVITHAQVGAAFAPRDYPIAYWTNVAITMNASLATFTEMVFNGDTAPFLTPWPRLIPPGGTIRTRVVKANALNARWQGILWIGPIGVYPPGMA